MNEYQSSSSLFLTSSSGIINLMDIIGQQFVNGL